MTRIAPRLAVVTLLLAAIALTIHLVAQPPRAAERSTAPPSCEVLALRDQALAELENERPKEAEAIYRRLIEAYPGDPLGHANLGIALLRQQRYDDALAAIDRALEVAPGNAKVLAIRGDILQWRGDPDGAIEAYRQAAMAAPDDLEILYALYQHAINNGSEADVPATLESMARLRPDNVVVILGLASQAVADGDRALASEALLRLEELVWQGPDLADRALGMARAALEGDDLSAARIPVRRLENVLKVSPMFRESLRELRTGILGIPLLRFAGERSGRDFGRPIRVRFEGRSIDVAPGVGRTLTVADLDGDRKPDLARVRAARGDGPPSVEIRLGGDDHATVASTLAVPSSVGTAESLHVIDVDNDGHLDLVATGTRGGAAWRGDGTGGFVPADFGLETGRGTSAVAIDFDIEGDLDVVVARDDGLELFRNNLAGPLEAVGDKVFDWSALERALEGVESVVASDLDRDGDLDLAIGHRHGVRWLENLRQGRMAVRTDAGLPTGGRIRDVVSRDLDNDGRPDLVTAGRGIGAWRNLSATDTATDPEGDDVSTRFEAWTLLGLPQDGGFDRVIALDADNDGRADLATAGTDGVAVFTQAARGRFARAPLQGGPASATDVVARDLDGDGDLDLVASGASGLFRLINDGGDGNRHLSVRLRGLDKGSSKNNAFGIGATVEIRDGDAYQYHEAASDVVHLGLGDRANAGVMRVVWTNGVPQNRLAVKADQTLVEQQLLKGSCPFLYTWDGEGIRFVTDLLWGAPIGLPVAPGVYADSDPSELVRIDGAALRHDGSLDLRITEELWEAAFFDHVRLWVVDHPRDVSVASNLRIVPGRGETPERVLAARDLQPVAQALDGRGDDVTRAVRHRDEVYADGYPKGRYQGVAPAPWTFTFDLGSAPARAIRLWLDGWIFPADASLNLAVAQRPEAPPLAPRLEVEVAPDDWRPLMDDMGFPPGKTKTIVVDTPRLPEGARRLRIVTSLWLHWDRIAWSVSPADGAPVVVARKLPSTAELRFRGFSAMVRQAPNAPHAFDYARTATADPWLPFPGRYTRYGDVRELLSSPDDRSVILAPGDEMRILFDLGTLAPPAPGQTRSLFLESHGWDKDADRNTGAGERMEPLPFRAMSGYPYGPGEAYPDTPSHRRYREQWLTREVTSDKGH